MRAIKISDFQTDPNQVIDYVNNTHEPILITGDKSSALLIGEDVWKNLTETFNLVSITGMRESIIKVIKTAVEKLDETLNW